MECEKKSATACTSSTKTAQYQAAITMKFTTSQSAERFLLKHAHRLRRHLLVLLHLLLHLLHNRSCHHHSCHHPRHAVRRLRCLRCLRRLRRHSHHLWSHRRLFLLNLLCIHRHLLPHLLRRHFLLVTGLRAWSSSMLWTHPFGACPCLMIRKHANVRMCRLEVRPDVACTMIIALLRLMARFALPLRRHLRRQLRHRRQCLPHHPSHHPTLLRRRRLHHRPRSSALGHPGVTRMTNAAGVKS